MLRSMKIQRNKNIDIEIILLETAPKNEKLGHLAFVKLPSVCKNLLLEKKK